MLTLSRSNLYLSKLYKVTTTQNACLTSVSIKLDGKQVDISDLPKKPKSLNLFQNYCAELGVSGEELKSKREELLRSFKENKSSYLAKNQKLIESHKNELKAYQAVYKKPVKLRDVSSLIQYCNKVIAKQAAKEANRKPRQLSFYNFFVKKLAQDGICKDLTESARRFKSLSPSELENYKRQYENYLRSSSD